MKNIQKKSNINKICFNQGIKIKITCPILILFLLSFFLLPFPFYFLSIISNFMDSSFYIGMILSILSLSQHNLVFGFLP